MIHIKVNIHNTVTIQFVVFSTSIEDSLMISVLKQTFLNNFNIETNLAVRYFHSVILKGNILVYSAAHKALSLRLLSNY